MIDELIKLAREGFMSINDHRQYNSTYSLGDLGGYTQLAGDGT